MAQDKLSPPRGGRRRLVVALLVVAICGGPILIPLWRVWRQSRAVRQIGAMRGRVSYAYDMQEVLPQWTRQIIPRTVQGVDLRGTAASNRDLPFLGDLTSLKQLDLSATKIGSEGLAPLGGLAELEKLYLDGTLVTDDDLSALAGLPALRELSLSKTGITNAGMKNLGAQPALTRLDIRDTRVGGAGLGSLAAFGHLRDLRLGEKQIDAVGGAQLLRLSSAVDIRVEIDAGTGRAARDTLNQSGVRAVGRDGRSETQLWDSQSAWPDSLAGTIETIARDSGWPAQRLDELVGAFCLALADRAFPRADAGAAAPPPASGAAAAASPARSISYAEFLELAKTSRKQDRSLLETFARTSLPQETTTELIRALEPFAAAPAETRLQDSQACQLRWIANALVHQVLGDERTTAALARLLKSENSFVRTTAIYSLDMAEHRRMLNDPAWQPGKAHAAAVVGLLSVVNANSGLEAQIAAAAALSQAVEVDHSQAAAVMPLLVAMLDAPDASRTPSVVKTIWSISEADSEAARGAVPVLLKMFEAAKPRSKALIVEALSYAASKHADDAEAAAAAVLPLLRNANLPQRSAICRLFRSAAEQQPASLRVIVPALVQNFNDSGALAGSAAGEALAAIADGVHARANR